MKCTWTSYMDFVFLNGILWSMCITSNYYACLVLFFWFLMTITPESPTGGKMMPKFTMKDDCHVLFFFSFFFFIKETMELRIIHNFFCPCPFVSLSFLCDNHTVSYSSNKGATQMLFETCNKCLQRIRGVNIDPKFSQSLFVAQCRWMCL